MVDLEPVVRAEANKRRPAVIVSNNGANGTAARLGRGVITVVPVTSNTARVYPFQVLLEAMHTGLERASSAQAEQIRSIAVERVGHRGGVVTGDLLAARVAILRTAIKRAVGDTPSSFGARAFGGTRTASRSPVRRGHAVPFWVG